MSEPVAPSRRRLFFALWPGDDLRRQITRDSQPFVQHAAGRAIEPGNLHVTVLFIGEVEPLWVERIVAAAGQVSVPAFVLTLDSVETWSRSNVMVLSGEHTPQPLERLAEGLRNSLLPLQIKLKRQLLHPHVTLVRKPRQAVMGQRIPLIRWDVTEFVLVESTLTSTGSRYTVNARWPLA